MQVLRVPAACKKLGDIGQATLWRLSKDDPAFPKPFKLSAGVTVWDESELDAWLLTKKQGELK